MWQRKLGASDEERCWEGHSGHWGSEGVGTWRGAEPSEEDQGEEEGEEFLQKNMHIGALRKETKGTGQFNSKHCMLILLLKKADVFCTFFFYHGTKITFIAFKTDFLSMFVKN